MKRRTHWLSLATLLIAGPLWAADANERRFVREGMQEGEVLHRIGPPDHEAVTSGAKGLPEEKTWTYFPTARDAQTLTVLQFRAGVVTSVERRIAR
jgi:hypothetical protein